MDSLNPVLQKITARKIKLCGWQLDVDGSWRLRHVKKQELNTNNLTQSSSKEFSKCSRWVQNNSALYCKKLQQIFQMGVQWNLLPW